MHPVAAACLAAASVGLSLLASAAAQSPQPATQADCTGLPGVHVFKEWPNPLENLAFSGGALYVSDTGAEQLLRLGSAGDVEVVATFADLHGVVADEHGTIHFTARQGSDEDEPWRVWRIGVDGPEAYSGLTRGWNGMAFADDGDLYLTDLDEGILRLPADDPESSELWLRAEGANGLSYDGVERILYAALTTDQRSPILRIPLDEPSAATEIHLSFGAAALDGPLPPSDPGLPLVPKVLDDLVLGPDRMLYAAAHGAGELLRVDPATGAACVLAKGLKEPTSVRVASEFPSYDGDLFVTTFGGEFYASRADSTLRLVGLPPAGAVPREPQILRIATGLELPESTLGSEGEPTTRTVPTPPLGLLLVVSLVALLARSTRSSTRRPPSGVSSWCAPPRWPRSGASTRPALRSPHANGMMLPMHVESLEDRGREDCEAGTSAPSHVASAPRFEGEVTFRVDGSTEFIS